MFQAQPLIFSTLPLVALMTGPGVWLASSEFESLMALTRAQPSETLCSILKYYLFKFQAFITLYFDVTLIAHCSWPLYSRWVYLIELPGKGKGFLLPPRWEIRHEFIQLCSNILINNCECELECLHILKDCVEHSLLRWLFILWSCVSDLYFLWLGAIWRVWAT